MESHRLSRTARLAATSLAVGALAAPAAHARPAIDPPSTPPRAEVVVQASHDGWFDWGSAGVGAAVGAGFALVGAGSFTLGHRARIRLAR